jgi:MFS family permease
VATALMTTTELIARDEDLTGGNAIWILSASAMTFAAFMPLGGRLADVSPPQWWFVSGSLGLSVCAVGNSFGEYFSDLPRRDSEKDEQLSHPVVLRASPLDHSPS